MATPLAVVPATVIIQASVAEVAPAHQGRLEEPGEPAELHSDPVTAWIGLEEGIPPTHPQMELGDTGTQPQSGAQEAILVTVHLLVVEQTENLPPIAPRLLGVSNSSPHQQEECHQDQMLQTWTAF